MRITDVGIIPVSVPFVEPFEIAGGRATHGNHVVVRLVSDDGQVGFGESAPMSSYSPQTQEAVVAEMNRLKGLLIGQDPFDLQAIHLSMKTAGADCFALAGLDIAMHDLAARSLAIPICRLIGGSLAEGIDLSWAIGFKPAEEMAREAKRYVAKGFRTVKLKVGDEPSLDLERVAAVRQAIGRKVVLKVDANQGYDLETAVRVGRRFLDHGVAVMEQPLPRSALSEMAKLRQKISIPIMVDESLYSIADASRILEEKAADVFNIKIMKPGGIRPSAKLAAVAEAAGMPCMLGSMPELGIGTLAGLQLAVTSGIFTWGAELIGPWMFRAHLLKETAKLAKGKLMLPKGPGLGIDVDEKELVRYSC